MSESLQTPSHQRTPEAHKRDDAVALERRSDLNPIALLSGFAIALLIASSHADTSPDDPLPTLYSQNPQQPIEIVAERRWTMADEEPKDARNVISNAKVQNPQRLPLGPSTRYVASFRSQDGKGPLKLVLDYAGHPVEKSSNPDDRMIVVNVHLDCPEAKAPCLRSIVQDSWFQQIFFIDPSESGVTSQPALAPDGRKIDRYLAHAHLAYDLVPDTPITLAISFSSPRHFATEQLRTTLLYGDDGTQPLPRGPLGINLVGQVAAAAALILLIALWWWTGRDNGRTDNEDAPRLLGLLVTVYGVALAGGGLFSDTLYYLIAGGVMAFSGLYLHFGSMAAVWWYAFGLVLMWVWSGIEVGPAFKPVFYRVAFATVIGLYLFSDRITSRLRPIGSSSIDDPDEESASP